MEFTSLTGKAVVCSFPTDRPLREAYCLESQQGELYDLNISYQRTKRA